MDIKEAERVVIAKPVASRPTCSSFRSFSELLAGAINASPTNSCSETAVAAIRPKTVRFKPGVSRPPTMMVSSQAELPRTATCNSTDKVSESDSKPTLVYKPQAKLVSKTTVSLLANMGNFNTSHQQALLAVEARAQQLNQEKQNFHSQFISNIQQSTTSRADTEQTSEPSKMTSQNMDEDPKGIPASTDRPSYDGYNWRKYGQKQVKGSEYPRSYYKCTHPNCPVKKKVERSFDGQIAEIVYKGEHNHVKPQPPKRNSSGTQGAGLASDGTGQDANNSLWSNQQNERNEGSEGAINAGGGTSENSCGLSGECEEGNKEGEDEEPRSKRRKSENQSSEAGISGEGVQDPNVVVHSNTDSEVLGDGFRWRKYGQKVVKGNPYPRSYYRCTSPKCNVRKHVERASDDPGSFITTYEGKHNHEMPLKNTAAVASEPESHARTSKDKA
ncbi:hypothetical protein SLE2022_102800 [Rubroshorea leprosula]